MKNEIFAERLRAARLDMGWSFRELAEHCGVSARTLQRYEAGEREPEMSALARIAKSLSVSLDWLAGLETEKA